MSTTIWKEALTDEERVDLAKMEDWRSWLSVAINWGLIFAALALVAFYPHVITVLFALVIIGARQLGLAVLMHEASHFTLFRNANVNDWVANWFCSYPVWADLKPYRHYHLQHHAKTWTAEDPDLNLATPFPTTWSSLKRKIWRDLSGQTGWKRAKAIWRRDMGLSSGKTGRGSDAGWHQLRGVLTTNLILLGILAALGHAELYLLWVGAWLTTYSLVMRIRAIAEHSMVTDPADPLKNTRTTLISPLERFFIAPNGVNYHLEHHLMMRVPHYKLGKFHRILHDRGILDQALIAHGYREVLTAAASRA